MMAANDGSHFFFFFFRLVRMAAAAIAEKTHATRRRTRATDARGVTALTPAAYWARPEAQRLYGVLEIDTHLLGCSATRVYARSMWWGLPTWDEARLLAAQANATHAAYDPDSSASRLYVAYGRTGEARTIAVLGRAWPLPAHFATGHRDEALDELIGLFTDYYLPQVRRAEGTDVAAEEAAVFAALVERMQANARTMPAALWAPQPGLFLEAETEVY